MCKLLHRPAVILTQILQGQGQSQQKELISESQRQELEATCLEGQMSGCGRMAESGLDETEIKECGRA